MSPIIPEGCEGPRPHIRVLILHNVRDWMIPFIPQDGGMIYGTVMSSAKKNCDVNFLLFSYTGGIKMNSSSIFFLFFEKIDEFI